MSRQLESKGEQREKARQDALVRALEFSLVDELRTQGIELCGFAIKYQPFQCLLTLKADVSGVRSVSFVASDSMMNSIVKASSMAYHESLKWQKDKYHGSGH